MIRFITTIFVFVMALFLVSPAATAPAAVWKKMLPSDCYFVVSTGDSIMCVGKSIFVLSKDGDLLSQSPPLEDTKSIPNTPPAFFLTKDHSIVMILSRCTVKKISPGGQILWTKSFCDSFPNAVLTGYLEDTEGNAYLYGTADYISGLIIKIGSNGTDIKKADTTLPIFTSMAILKDTLFTVSKNYQAPGTTGSLVAFDTKLNFVKRIIDTACGTLLTMDDRHIVTLNMLNGSALFKRSFFATADIVLKRYSISGKVDSIAVFDFGKYESPLSIQKYHDGFLIVTLSDETVNMGTNYLNYFITKLDVSLKKEWQLRFGTDTSGLSGGKTNYRRFCVDDGGVILATHNDTLFKFKDTSTTTPTNPCSQKLKTGVLSEGKVKVFDCQGRLLFGYPATHGTDADRIKRSNTAFGLKLIRSGSGLQSEASVILPK